MMAHFHLVNDEHAITDNLTPFMARSGFTVSIAGDEVRRIVSSGMGLARVRAIVDCHGGETGLRSRPGQGRLSRCGYQPARAAGDS